MSTHEPDTKPNELTAPATPVNRVRFSPAIEQSITDTLHTIRTAAEAAFWTLVEWRKAAERHGR